MFTANLHPTPFGHAFAPLASQLSQVLRSLHSFTTRVTRYSRATHRPTVASRKFGKFNPALRARHLEECQPCAREAAPSAREAAVALPVVLRLGAPAHFAPVVAFAALSRRARLTRRRRTFHQLARHSNERQLEIGEGHDAPSHDDGGRCKPTTRAGRSAGHKRAYLKAA